MNRLKRYIDRAVRREIHRICDGSQTINSVVGKMYAFLRSFKPADKMQQFAIQDAMGKIRRIPDMMESDSGEIKAFRYMDEIDMNFVRYNVYKGPDGRKLANLYGDLHLAMSDYNITK